MKPILSGFTLLAISLCVGCQPTSLDRRPQASNLPVRSAQDTSAVIQRPSYGALEKVSPAGSLTIKGQTVTIQLQLPPASFKIQRLDLSAAAQITATLSDSRGKTYTPDGAVAGRVTYPADGVLSLSFNNVVPDDLLLAEIQVREGSGDIPQADLAVALRHTGVTPANATINFQTTAIAKTLKSLLASNAARARSINLSDLTNLLATITGVTGTAPNFSYSQNHPSLVKTAELAADLVASNPTALTATAANYRGAGATVNLNVSGLNGTDKVQVQITDAASGIRTDLGNGSSSGNTLSLKSTPGSNLKVLVTPFGTPAQTYTYSASPTTLTLTEGGTQSVTITALPNLTVGGFTPASGAAGTSVVINGTGFTGATAVTFGGVNATSFTVNSNTQITAVVPHATEGPIAVVNGSTVTSAASFDVQRVMRVKVGATGLSNGTSWANAYPSLQTALTASAAGDEIWIAAGRYIPGTAQSNTFQMRTNVDIYGGFGGNETLLSQRNASANPVILSGDIGGDDTGSGASYVRNGLNTYVIVTGANNAILDSVTIQGANSNTRGGGMRNISVSPTLNKVTFLNNHVPSYGGGMYAQTCSPVLTDVTFAYNSSGSNGGGLHSEGSTPNMTGVSFDHNTANNSGGGLFLNNYTGAVLDKVTFTANAAGSSGGGVYIYGYSSPIFKNAVFVNNAASSGGGMYLSYTTPTLTNVTFANNTNNAIYDGGTVTVTLKNGLFWNNPPGIGLGSGLGNVEPGSDPFVNVASPNGADGVPRNSDDGLRIKAGASVISQGVTGADVPLTDILGTSRSGNPEPGAYEYIGPPTFTSLSHSGRAINALISIFGSNFYDVQSVSFNGTPATDVTVISPSEILVRVPGAPDGPITVVTDRGNVTTSSFDVTGPSIFTFSPTAATVGSNVDLLGLDFNYTSSGMKVFFNGVEASYTVSSLSELTAIVPPGATTGKISIRINNYVVQSSANFTVTTLSGFSPASGAVGSTVTLTGSGFNGVTAVRFNGVNASFTVNSASQITATVPTGASSGLITIIAGNGLNSATSFSVL